MSIDRKHQTDPLLVGMRILIVEDQMIMAMMLEDILKGLGCDVTKVGRVSKAVHAIKAGDLNAAILDIDIAGEAVYPVAHELKKRSIPFIFSSGYNAVGLPLEYGDCPTLSKHFQREELAPLLRNAIRNKC